MKSLSAMASIPLLTPHSHITPDTAVVYSGHLRHPMWPANLIQKSNKLPLMSIRVRQGVIGIFWFFAQHLSLWFFYTIFFLTVFDMGKIEVHVSDQPIRKLHYEMQGVDLWHSTKCKEWFDGQECLWSHIFSFLTFDLWDCLAQIWSHVPKYIILKFQREDKLLLNIEQKQTIYCKLLHPVITQQWCGISLPFA